MPSRGPVMTATLDAADARVALDFTLPAEREAHEPPEARGLPRDGVALMASRGAAGEISHHAFTSLPSLLLPGDLLVVNTSATLPAAVPLPGGLTAGLPRWADGRARWPFTFPPRCPTGTGWWSCARPGGAATVPYRGGSRRRSGWNCPAGRS